MGQILVRNLDADIKQRLRRRAERHGRSMAEEIREILRAAAEQSADPVSGPGLGTCIARRFAGLGLIESFAALEGQAACPADFESA